MTTSDSPAEGTYHLQLKKATGNASRTVDLSGRSGVHLTFWAKASGFGGNHTAAAKVSSDGTNFTTVQTWTSAGDDGIYRSYDIDLSSYSMTSGFVIAFDANMGGNNAVFHVDDIEVVD